MQGGEGAGAEADDSQHPLGKSSTFCMKCNLISTVVVGETGQVKETESRRLGLRETAGESIALGWVGQGKARQGKEAGGAFWDWRYLGQWSPLRPPAPLYCRQSPSPAATPLPHTRSERAGLGSRMAAAADLPFLFPRLVSASDRESRLEEVRSAFLASYSRTIGLKAVPPSPSGAIGGLLEQFVRGVGLRGSSTL